jgi:hypothetical protein
LLRESGGAVDNNEHELHEQRRFNVEKLLEATRPARDAHRRRISVGAGARLLRMDTREWTLLIAVAVTTPFLLAFSALLSIFRYRWVLPFWRRKYRSVHDTDSASQSPSGEPPLLRLRYVALVSFIMVFLAASVIPTSFYLSTLW